MIQSSYPQSAFVAWLLILAWAPLPLASNRPWALALLILLCALLTLSLIALTVLRNIDLPALLKPYRVPILLWLCVPLWSTLQTVELPLWLVQMLAPETAAVWRDMNAGSGRITLDPGRTQLLAAWSWMLWCFFIATLLLLDTPARLRSAALFIVYCGVFQALYGSFMTLSGIEYGFLVEKEAYRGVATGTFVNRNHLAGYLEMSLAVGIGLLVASLQRDSTRSWQGGLRRLLDALLGAKIRLRVFLALMVIALVLTHSRMGNTAFFSSLIVTGLGLMLIQRKLHKGALILFVSLILIDVLILGQWFGFDELAARLETTSVEREARDEVVRDTLVMIAARPLAGVGLGAYAVAYPQYQQPDVIGYYDHAHNDYLQFSSELGLLGMLPLAALVLLSFARAWHALYARHDRLARGIAFAAAMGMLALLIHSAADFNLQIPANAQLFTILLAFAWKAGTMSRTTSNTVSAWPDTLSFKE